MSTWIETGENGTGRHVKEEAGPVIGRIWKRIAPLGDSADVIRVGGLTAVAHDVRREHVEAVAVVTSLDCTVPPGWSSAVETMAFDELQADYRRLESAEITLMAVEAAVQSKEHENDPPLNRESPWRRF